MLMYLSTRLTVLGETYETTWRVEARINDEWEELGSGKSSTRRGDSWGIDSPAELLQRMASSLDALAEDWRREHSEEFNVAREGWIRAADHGPDSLSSAIAASRDDTTDGPPW